MQCPSCGSERKLIFSGLTPQQVRVAQFLARGKNAREIALAMRLSDVTVRHYIDAIYERYHVHSRGEFLAKALGTAP